MDNPLIPQPKVISLTPAPHRSWGKWLLAIVGVLVLALGLAVGTILVQRQQDVRSKATGCDMRWYADPNSACGQATQQPKENATGVSLTPNFHWDYGGYRPGETGCVQPSSCSSYGAIVYLAKGDYSDSSIIASCNAGSASAPIKDAPFSCFRKWRDGPPLGTLEPNTSYSWVVTPFFNGTVHAEQSWKSHFTTGGNATASCQRVTADKDLASVKLNDTVTFSGFGATSSATDKIDLIKFIISTPSGQISSDDVPATFDGSLWKAIKQLVIKFNDSYTVRIQAHWLKADGTSEWKE